MANNIEAFEQAKKFIQQNHRFVLASHARTDGDDGGSMLAMTIALESLGKQATPVAWGGVPPSLQFLPKQTKILEDVPNPATSEFYDAIILFGCNNQKRPGLEKISESTLPILNIDHHHDNQKFGTVNLVDSSKSSVAELVLEFIKYIELPITPDMAKCLLTGIFTDTGSFMHANTQASTLEAAGELLKYGARIDKIHEFTFQNKDLKSLKAWGVALENTRLVKNGQIAISVMTQEDLDSVGDLSEDTFAGLVETLNKIPGTRFAIFLRQAGETIKGSMRSEENKDMDVSFLAKLLGGGGHKLAAGFTVNGKLLRLPDGGWKIERK